MTTSPRRVEGRRFKTSIKALLALAVTVLSLVGCDETPTGRNQLSLVPDRQLASMGAKAFEELKHTRPLVADPESQRYVLCVVERVINTLSDSAQGWEVALFDDPTPNAFALPGKKIGIHSGMLRVAGTQGQLAAVVSHEVAHLLANHANERVTQQLAVQGGLALFELLSEQQGGWKHEAIRRALGLGAGVGFLLPFSRLHEREADAIGLDLMARAGFDPEESLALWQNMARTSRRQPIEFLSTHPSHESRDKELQKQLASSRQLFEQSKSLGKQPQCR